MPEETKRKLLLGDILCFTGCHRARKEDIVFRGCTPPVQPRKATCSSKRSQFNRKVVFQPLFLKGHVGFLGLYWDVLLVLSIYR